MSVVNDSASAFPVLDSPDGNALYCRDAGMSLRDFFAAQIASGMAAFSGTAGISYGPKEIAGRSYEVADAMIEARKRLASDERAA